VVEISQGELLRISGGYLTSWRGMPRLTLDEKDRIEKADLPEFPREGELASARSTTLESVFSEGGAIDVNIRGIAVDIKENSGLVLRCPECKRVVQKGECRIHNVVEPVPDLRVKGIIDDATGSCVFVLNRHLTESMLGASMEDCQKALAEGKEGAGIYSRVEGSVLGRPFDVRGDVTRDQYGFMLIATDIKPVSIDAAHEARLMAERWASEGDGPGGD
jgi:replication factor A1